MIKRVALSNEARADLTRLERSSALRITRAIYRFASTGAGDIKRLQGILPPQFRLRVGDYRVRFHDHGDWLEVLRVLNRKDAYR